MDGNGIFIAKTEKAGGKIDLGEKRRDELLQDVKLKATSSPTTRVEEHRKRAPAALANVGSMCFCKNGYVSNSREM